jgi:hypothetical protein
MNNVHLPCSQLLVLELAFQLLRLGHLSDGFVEVVLSDCVPVIFDGEQSTIVELVVEMKEIEMEQQ